MTSRQAGEAAAPSRDLARDLKRWYGAGLPVEVEHEGVRCLLNAVGAGVGGSIDSATNRLFHALQAANGPGSSPVLGRADGLPQTPSIVVNAFAVTQNDFDDAHFQTILHPGAAALAALLASGTRDTQGSVALRAFALGCEAQLAVALAISPSHYSRGWHITANCAGVGAAITAGLLIGLDESGLADAIDLAILRVVGMRQAHGTEAKGFQVGRGAANGFAAVRAIAEGVSGRVPEVLGVHEGFLHGIADSAECNIRVDGDRWHLLDVGYKPYPAGMVCFGGIEAALRAATEVDIDGIESIHVEVAPLAVELAGNHKPATESEARVSLPHGIASALVEGRAGLDQFSLRAVKDPLISRVRDMVELVPRVHIPTSGAILHIQTDRGARKWLVEEPRGGPKRPLTDADLDTKVLQLASRVETVSGAQVVAAVRGLPGAPNLAEFTNAIRMGDRRA